MVVNPNTTASMTDDIIGGARAAAAPGTEIVGSTAERGVESVETNVDEVWGALAVLEQIRRGESIGVDGYVIACFGDTGLPAAREVAAGPVVGMTEAALFTAALIAARFAIVTLPPRTREQSARVLRATGLADRATIRTIDVPVAEVAADSLHLLDAVAEQGRLAMREDAAEAIVLGCAGLAALSAPLSDRLGAPVVEGVAAAVTMVEGLLAQGLSTSRVSTYGVPRELGI
jgi:allantoin racemase